MTRTLFPEATLTRFYQRQLASVHSAFAVCGLVMLWTQPTLSAEIDLTQIYLPNTAAPHTHLIAAQEPPHRLMRHIDYVHLPSFEIASLSEEAPEMITTIFAVPAYQQYQRAMIEADDFWLILPNGPSATDSDSFFLSRQVLSQIIPLPAQADAITHSHFRQQLAGFDYVIWPSQPLDLLADRRYSWPVHAAVQFSKSQTDFDGMMILSTDTNAAEIALFNEQDSLILSFGIDALYRDGYQATIGEMSWRDGMYDSAIQIGAFGDHAPTIWGQFATLMPEETVPLSGYFTNLAWPETTSQPN